LTEPDPQTTITLPLPLIPGILIRRYKRFLADVRLRDGVTVTAHCPNPGRLQGLNQEGLEVRLSRSDNPARKLEYTWELVQGPNDVWVGVNTMRSNSIVQAGIKAGRIKELSGYPTLRGEVAVHKSSRLDFLLSGRGPDCYLEVKNVTLVESGTAYFPDAVTNRGARHMQVLTDLKLAGHRAVVLFLVQRSDGRRLSPADHIDPNYGQALRRAVSEGVEVYAYRAKVAESGIAISGPIPVEL
jgi:sugar fermentation stimulation protein A